MLLQDSNCRHAVTNAPVDPNSVCFARVLSGGSFPHVLAGSASTLDGFGTCSVFIHITACLLADPLPGLLHQGLRTFHYFHARLGCYRLERKLPGGFNTLPLEFCAFPRRTKTGSNLPCRLGDQLDNRAVEFTMAGRNKPFIYQN